MTHAEMDELYDLYVLGALEPALAAEIEQHLLDGCDYCKQHVAEATRLAAGLAAIAEPVNAPAGLRERVAALVSRPAMVRPATHATPWKWATALLAAACLVLLAFAAWSSSRLQRTQSELAGLINERDQLRTALASISAANRSELVATRNERDQLRFALQVIRRSDTRSVRFGKGNGTPHGWVFDNPNGGLVLVGADLPRVPANRTLELWLVPRTGAPQPAGLFRPTTAGDSVHVSPLAVNPAQVKAVAVSVEPRTGSTAPTTTPFLIVPVD